MQPGYTNYTNPDPAAKLLVKKRRRIAVIILVIIALAVTGFLAWRSSQFHLVSTDPSMDSFAAIAPSVSFNFSKELSQDGLAVSSNPNIITSYEASGKTLKINLSDPLQVDQPYSITIISLSSKNGDHIANKTFNFIPKNVAFDKLSKNLQQAILEEQTKRAPSKDNYTYHGADDMTSSGGLTQDQLGDVQQALFQYLQKNNLTDKVSDIYFTNIVSAVAHPDKPLDPDVMHFSVSFNTGAAFNAKVAMPNIFTARLYLTDAKTGDQVYDSQNIDSRKAF